MLIDLKKELVAKNITIDDVGAGNQQANVGWFPSQWQTFITSLALFLSTVQRK